MRKGERERKGQKLEIDGGCDKEIPLTMQWEGGMQHIF